MDDKGKKKIFNSTEGEKISKMKAYNILKKEDLAVEVKRKQRM